MNLFLSLNRTYEDNILTEIGFNLSSIKVTAESFEVRCPKWTDSNQRFSLY